MQAHWDRRGIWGHTSSCRRQLYLQGENVQLLFVVLLDDE